MKIKQILFSNPFVCNNDYTTPYVKISLPKRNP